mgnify:CR=1 FL=1
MTANSINKIDPAKDPETYAAMAGSLNIQGALGGLKLFGIMIILIQAVMIVTTEYGHGTAKTSVLATPKRWQLPVAKFIVYGIVAAVLTFLVSVVSIFLAHALASGYLEDSKMLEGMSFQAEDVWTIVGRLVLYAVLCVLVGIGTGYLVRSTAAGIAVLLLWKLIGEGLLVGMIPKIKDWLPPYMPFSNIESAVGMTDVPDAPWGQGGSIVYFGLICLAVFIIGTAMLKKRDA